MTRRHIPAFIDDLRAIRVKRAALKPGSLATTQSYVSGADAAAYHALPATHTIDPFEEEIFTQDETKREVAASLPTYMPSDTHNPYRAGQSTFAQPAQAQSQQAQSQQHLTVPQPTFHGKLTPAKRAALAKAAEEEKQLAALRAVAAPVPAPVPKPAAALPPALPRPAPAAAALPRPAPIPKPLAPAHVPRAAPGSPRASPAAVAPKPKAPAAASSASAPKEKARPPCPFAESCYRQNPVHRVEQSHPGDHDYPKKGGAAAAKKPAAKKKKKRGSDDDDDMDDDDDDGEDLYPKSKKGAASTASASKRARKVVNYRDEPEDSDEEAAFEAPENTQDREFIADDDEEPEAGDSDDDWGEDAGGAKPKPKQKKSGQKRKASHSDEESDAEYQGQQDDDAEEDEEEESMPDVDEAELPKCPYGAGCTRKNPAHFKEQRHPHVDTEMRPKIKGGNKDAAAAAHPPAKKARPSSPASAAVAASAPRPAAAAAAAAPAPPKVSLKDVLAASAAAPAPAPAPAAAAAAAAPKAPLPTIFSGLEAVLYGAMDETSRKLITRFWMAFDGDLASNVSLSTTHLISDAAVDSEMRRIAREFPSIMIVRSKWALESIRKKELLLEGPFLRDEELKE